MELSSIAVFLIVATFLRQTDAFGTGAPAARCADMMPNHGAAAQSSASPYAITVDGDMYYSTGQNKMITVMDSSGTMLKGGLCQMRLASDPSMAVGTFSLADNESDLQLLACDGNAATGVTHANNNDKPMLRFYWMASANMGDVKVMCTLVQTQPVYWTQVLSATLSYQAAMGGASTTMAMSEEVDGDSSGSSTLVGSSLLLAVIVTVRRLLL